ncbi:MAG: type II and III secretion system protein family protein [Lautropia sp.]
MSTPAFTLLGRRIAIAGYLASLWIAAAPGANGAEPVARVGSRAATAPVMAEPSAEVLQLSVGESHVLRQRRVRRIVVGSGRVLQVTALDREQILIIPEAAGESSLHLWGHGGEQRRLTVVVTERDATRIAREVEALLGAGSAVRTRVVGEQVLLESTRPTEDDVARITEIAKRYPQVVSMVSRAGFERMVQMEVRMIEIARNALERLGVRWQSGNGTPFAIEGPSFGLIGDVVRTPAFLAGGAAADAGLAVRPRIAPFATAASLVASLTSMIDLLVQSGDAAILAEPRLSCRSGGTARFVAGGELPIPVLSANGAASVQFKEYGVRFEVSPVVNEAGMIAASLQAEVSSINPEVMVRDIPGLRKQSASTQANLVEGQTLVIAGMVSNEISGSVDRIPGLGGIPILGKLFSSRRFQNRETEMIVLITPRLQEQVADLDRARGRQLGERYGALRRQLGMQD